MIHMGVGQNDCVQGFRVEREGAPIALAQHLEPLEESTIDQDLPATHAEQVFGACHGIIRAKKLKFHHRVYSLRSPGMFLEASS